MNNTLPHISIQRFFASVCVSPKYHIPREMTLIEYIRLVELINSTQPEDAEEEIKLAVRLTQLILLGVEGNRQRYRNEDCSKHPRSLDEKERLKKERMRKFALLRDEEQLISDQKQLAEKAKLAKQTRDAEEKANQAFLDEDWSM